MEVKVYGYLQSRFGFLNPNFTMYSLYILALNISQSPSLSLVHIRRMTLTFTSLAISNVKKQVGILLILVHPLFHLKKILNFSTASFMKTVPSVYTLLVNAIFLSQSTKVA